MAASHVVYVACNTDIWYFANFISTGLIENSVNGIPAPSISSSQKQKASSDESEINEKLGIEFEMLYWQCCKLEKVSQSLDDSIIDYELNLVEDELLSNCLSISVEHCTKSKQV